MESAAGPMPQHPALPERRQASTGKGVGGWEGTGPALPWVRALNMSFIVPSNCIHTHSALALRLSGLRFFSSTL